MSFKLKNSLNVNGFFAQVSRTTNNVGTELLSISALFFVVLSGIALHYQQYITSTLLYILAIIFDIIMIPVNLSEFTISPGNFT